MIELMIEAFSSRCRKFPSADVTSSIRCLDLAAIRVQWYMKREYSTDGSPPMRCYPTAKDTKSCVPTCTPRWLMAIGATETSATGRENKSSFGLELGHASSTRTYTRCAASASAREDKGPVGAVA
jgi:hypothetical protein